MTEGAENGCSWGRVGSEGLENSLWGGGGGEGEEGTGQGLCGCGRCVDTEEAVGWGVGGGQTPAK